ncbi:alpha/beta hydrolase [Motilimonas eburnea]|uniref:alpha/beta hydrolase n=1 Tax=Motilimonas eburnea TaxID=1737488 RepID=UPI001E4F313F|nr:alpha/beta hydrolase [Motilimonas eburnea]MCE2573263.1 alpha/beta hydrolase [Motilimonas eburnea]
MKYVTLLICLFITGCNSGGSSSPSVDSGSNQNSSLTIEEQLSFSAYQRIYYGTNSQQFYDLRLPADTETSPSPLPVIVLLHGGCWVKSTADYSYFDPLAEDLTRRGFVTINAEYRALGDTGGGWPGTFEDVNTIINSVNTLADTLPIDIQQVVVAGHSAGGHLALWAGLRDQIEVGQPLYDPQPLVPALTVGLAAITDLGQYWRTSCGGGINRLIGVQPSSDDFAQRLIITSPMQMKISLTPTLLVQGKNDSVVPVSQANNYLAKLRENQVETISLQPSSNHFSILNVDSSEWQQTVAAIESMLK